MYVGRSVSMHGRTVALGLMFEHDNPMIGLGEMNFGLIKEFNVCFYVVLIEVCC